MLIDISESTVNFEQNFERVVGATSSDCAHGSSAGIIEFEGT